MPPPTNAESFAQLLSELILPKLVEAQRTAPRPPPQVFSVTRIGPDGKPMGVQVTLPQAIAELTDTLKVSMQFHHATIQELSMLRAELVQHRQIGEEMAAERKKRRKRRDEDDD